MISFSLCCVSLLVSVLSELWRQEFVLLLSDHSQLLSGLLQLFLLPEHLLLGCNDLSGHTHTHMHVNTCKTRTGSKEIVKILSYTHMCFIYLSDAAHHPTLHHHGLIVLSLKRSFLCRLHQIIWRSLHSITSGLRGHKSHVSMVKRNMSATLVLCLVPWIISWVKRFVKQQTFEPQNLSNNSFETLPMVTVMTNMRQKRTEIL